MIYNNTVILTRKLTNMKLIIVIIAGVTKWWPADSVGIR